MKKEEEMDQLKQDVKTLACAIRGINLYKNKKFHPDFEKSLGEIYKRY